MSAHDQPSAYRIGDLTLDPARRTIERHGTTLPCGKLTFDLLELLATHAPHVVSRAELVACLWGGRYVSPATVKQRVALLRQTLGDQAESPTYIKVARGQGYALIPEVRPLRPRGHPGNWARFVLVAGTAMLAFVVGAEIGYQDGLRPRVPDLQGSASILVTSWPLSGRTPRIERELPREEYAFVMGVAEQVLRVINDTGLVQRLDPARAHTGGLANDSLTLLANATQEDHESINVTLTILNDGRGDFRVSRVDELRQWSREARDVALEVSGNGTPTRFLGGAGSPARADERIRVFSSEPVDHPNKFMLIASFDFDRIESLRDPRSAQIDAALSVASAIDEQIGHLRLGAGGLN